MNIVQTPPPLGPDNQTFEAIPGEPNRRGGRAGGGHIYSRQEVHGEAGAQGRWHGEAGEGRQQHGEAAQEGQVQGPQDGLDGRPTSEGSSNQDNFSLQKDILAFFSYRASLCSIMSLASF